MDKKNREFSWMKYQFKTYEEALKKYTCKEEFYDELSADMDCIINMATKIKSLEATVSGLKELIDWEKEYELKNG